MAAAARRKPAPQPVAANEGIEVPPTPERMQHDAIAVVDVPKEGRKYSVVQKAWIIDTYYKRGVLGYNNDQNERNYTAASRFHRLAEKCLDRSPKSCLANPERIRGSAHQADQISARDEMSKMHAFVGSTGLACLSDVVFRNIPAEQWAARRGITRARVGIDILRIALDDAGHFWRTWRRDDAAAD